MKLAVRTNDWEIHTRNDLTTKEGLEQLEQALQIGVCLLYTSPSPRDRS